MARVPRLMPALVTPFDASGEIDLEAHRHNLAQLWTAGIKGFLIAGSTGEGPYLEAGERAALLEAARELFGRKVYLTCGIAAESLRQGKELLREMSNLADSALVITPTTLARNRSSYVEAYFAELAESSSIPILLYSVPAVTAYELPEESIARLAQHQAIVGIKDSGGHPVRIQRMLAAVPDDFLVFTGSTHAVNLAMAAGAYGAITASTNYMASKLLTAVRAARSNPLKARPLQTEMSRIAAVVEAHGVPGVKYAASRAGLSSGLPRAPLAELAPAHQAEIRSLLG